MLIINRLAGVGFGVAVLAAITTPAVARIECQGNFQIGKYVPIATPYCEEAQIARVAQSRGFKVTAEEVHRSVHRIEDAVDYRDVVACVRGVSDGRKFQLLEALSAAVADAVLARFPVERVRVRVRKPDVKLGIPVEHTAATAERARS